MACVYNSPSAFPEDYIHPVLINDMRTFEGLCAGANDSSNRMSIDFDFDLSQAFPLPVDTQYPSDFQTLHDISGYFGSDFFGSNSGPMQPSNVSLTQEAPILPAENATAEIDGVSVQVPVLHATWQSFVEQLGF